MAKKIRLVFEVQGAKDAEGATKKVDSSLGQLAKKAGLVTLAFVGAGKLVDAFKSAVTVGAEFEQNIKNLSVIAGATGGKLKQLEQSALKLGGSTKFTASEVAGLSIEFSKLGFTADEILEVTEGTLNLATAFGLDLSNTASVAGSTLRAFGLDASETTRMTDVMAVSFRSTALDMEKFSGAMQMVAPVAKIAGFSLEETTAMLGKLADSGISGSLAGTQLRSILLDMSNESSNFAKRVGGSVTNVEELQVALKKLNEEGVSTAEMKQLVGKRAVSAFGVLLAGAEDVGTLTTQFQGATGAGKLMATEMLDTLQSKFKIMESATSDLGIAFFNTFDETLKKATDVMTDAISGLSEFFKVLDESPLETAIRRIDELGGSTLSLRTELAEMNLEQAKMGIETLPTVAEAMKKQADNAKELVEVETQLRGVTENLNKAEEEFFPIRLSGLRMDEMKMTGEHKALELAKTASAELLAKKDALLEDNEVQAKAIERRRELANAEMDLTAVQSEALALNQQQAEADEAEVPKKEDLLKVKSAEIQILEEKLRLMNEGMEADKVMMEVVQFQLDNVETLNISEAKLIQLKIQKLALMAKEAKAVKKEADEKKANDKKKKDADDKKAKDDRERQAEEMVHLVANSATAREIIMKKVRMKAMEGLVSLVAGIMEDYPYPLNIGLAGTATVAGVVALDWAMDQAKKMQTGGLIPGFGGGDRVPALLERGEFVMNKEAVQNIGVSNLMAQNTGEGGGGTVFHFSGPVTNEDYVRDFIIPQIDDTLQRRLS